MLEPVYIFLVCGVFAMSTALSASALIKLPEEQRPKCMQDPSRLTAVMLLGNVSALTLIGVLAFGFSRLEWWLPLGSVFITFPLVHYVFLQRLLGDARNLLLSGALTLLAIPVLWWAW
ncbi:hypothetical protein [Nitrincola tapanii]|uniref:DUF3325 domain-containing protein n=1 Tax=Nitrincola tapanii TaxID=1708751 RepID=A0A5A9W267_9GAMM|nr:hypothetical protein [Nitrincola tapanii]KAA0874185.1 hypothetical protein E1H14_10445 [Nitrincola tapanii]